MIKKYYINISMIILLSSCMGRKSIIGHKTYIQCENAGKLEDGSFWFVYLFLNNHSVKIDNANVDGEYVYHSDVKGVVFKMPGWYSEFYTKKELLSNQFVILKETGTMHSDTISDSLEKSIDIRNAQIDLMIEKWKQGKKK